MRFRLPGTPLKNPKLTVLAELPPGVKESELSFGEREAWGTVDGVFLVFHFCDECGGWIEGYSERGEVNNLDTRHLAGRRGTTYSCRRCGVEIAFMGIVS